MDRSSLKSYGTIDASWNADKIKALLQDALNMAKGMDLSLLVVQDESGNIAIIPNSRGSFSNPRILACGITPKDQSSQGGSEPRKEFWDNVNWSSYTLEEMVPRVHDCLLRGIIEYGGLRFLSEGRRQISYAFEDARTLVKLHNKPFILGYRNDGNICISALSERSRFIDHLSCIVTKSGTWSISNTRSTKGVFDEGELQYAILGKDLYPETYLFKKNCKNKSCRHCQSKK